MLNAFATDDPRFTVFDRLENRGYTKSINEAVKLTGADWIVILNSDTVVADGWLAHLHDAVASDPQAGMSGPLSNAASYQSIPKLREQDGTWSRNQFIMAHHVNRVQAEVDRCTERAYPSVPLLNGFCTLISRRVFDRCGLYDEDAFPEGYGEETDLCLRALKAGFKLVVADDCFVYHHKSVSFGIKGRRTRTRSGNVELGNKHPGLSIQEIERMLQDCSALAGLRSRLAQLRMVLQ
jgi:GT2 family glycosyltransferase